MPMTREPEDRILILSVEEGALIIRVSVDEAANPAELEEEFACLLKRIWREFHETTPDGVHRSVGPRALLTDSDPAGTGTRTLCWEIDND